MKASEVAIHIAFAHDLGQRSEKRRSAVGLDEGT